MYIQLIIKIVYPASETVRGCCLSKCVVILLIFVCHQCSVTMYIEQSANLIVFSK